MYNMKNLNNFSSLITYIFIYLFQILGLKILEIDDYELAPNDLLKYADKFKIILEKKENMKPALYRYFVTRLIDQVFLASVYIF